MPKSTFLEHAGSISAQAQFDKMYKDGDGDVTALKAFLTNLWEEHKPIFAKYITDPENSPHYSTPFVLPKGLAFTDKEIREVLVNHIEDFEGLRESVCVFETLARRDKMVEFTLFINYNKEHEMQFDKLKRERELSTIQKTPLKRGRDWDMRPHSQ